MESGHLPRSFFMIKKYKFINLTASLFGILYLSWFAVFKPSVILFAGICTSWFGYFLIFLLLTPAGNITLGDKSQRLPYFQWLSKIVTANVVLFCFTIGAIYSFLWAGPGFTLGALSYTFSKEVLSEYTLSHWGIFPWGVYGVWGLIIAYVAYIKKGSPNLYQTGHFLSVKLQAMFKTFVETTCYVSTLTVITMSAAIIVLLIAYAIYSQLQLHHFLVPVASVCIMSMMVSFFMFSLGRRIFKIFARRRLGINRVIILFVIIMLPLLLLLSILNGFIVTAIPELYEQSKCRACGSIFNIVPVADRFASLYWGWFMIWAPLAGSYLATISKGRTIREYALGVLFVPIILFISFQMVSEKEIKMILAFLNNKEYMPFLYIALALVCSWALLAMTRRCFDNKLLISGYFPISALFKRDRIKVNNVSKVIGISKFGNTLVIAMIMIIVMHTIAGWYMIQFQIAAIATITISALYFAIDFLLLQFFADKFWIGNKNIAPFKNAYVGVPKKKKAGKKGN